ncbi:M23 family metallopeptidase [Streptomyces sp. NPDC000941]
MPLTDHAPHAFYGIHSTAEEQSGGYAGYDAYQARSFGEPSPAYSDEDPLFGPMPCAYAAGAYNAVEYGMDQHATGSYGMGQDSLHVHDTTTAACGAYPTYQEVYDTYGFSSAPAPYATGFESAPDVPPRAGSGTGDLSAPSCHWGMTREADPAEQWHTDDYAVADIGHEEHTQTWSARSSADADVPLDSSRSPGSPEDPDASESSPVALSISHRAPSRSRKRRGTNRRSALLTVAAPSVAFLGVAGIAAASVTLDDQSEKTEQAIPDTPPAVDVQAANGKIDSQLAGLTGDAEDFADRASRTQERIDLRQRRLKEQEQRRAEAARKRAEAARKEALRPKFALPVTQRGVGELFGAAGSMWSNRHTGLDFPVPMNTPVMAVTDGTVEAKWNRFYGNMVIITAPDGTETWYCHLAGAKLRNGHVKAGEVIAFAGSSGNSSGPHLHLEVHPGGGDAIDPLAWLRSHGLEPT